jgi:hypothetical protein
MSRHFKEIAKKIISQYNLQNLSGDGWTRMEHIEKELNSGATSPEDAVERFLRERDFHIKYENDRNFKKKMADMIRY